MSYWRSCRPSRSHTEQAHGPTLLIRWPRITTACVLQPAGSVFSAAAEQPGSALKHDTSAKLAACIYALANALLPIMVAPDMGYSAIPLPFLYLQ